VTTASGAKFGKTEAGAVWLDPALTTPYKLYQFWVNTDDRDTERYLKLFTLLSHDEIKRLMASHATNPSAREPQKQLATLVTELVHGGPPAKPLWRQRRPVRRVQPQGRRAQHLRRPGSEILLAVDGAAELTLVDAVVRASLATSRARPGRSSRAGFM
jgi:tyrosyl-tRNA synthetase